MDLLGPKYSVVAFFSILQHLLRPNIYISNFNHFFSDLLWGLLLTVHFTPTPYRWSTVAVPVYLPLLCTLFLYL
uniref:Uncharacterized protein n=1 Tax=Octopus bimaculoides TaxID=37653 RepID=A0A0L8HL57_OCTBM